LKIPSTTREIKERRERERERIEKEEREERGRGRKRERERRDGGTSGGKLQNFSHLN